MQPDATTAGYLAFIAFLAGSGIGAGAQAHKLYSRTQAWRRGILDRDRICDGLQPTRELWSFAAFLFFAFSALTRSYVDAVLLFSRLPVVLLSTVILWFLQLHGLPQARLFFAVALLADVLLGLLMAFSMSGHDASFLAVFVDPGLLLISALLFYGKQRQARRMLQEERSRGVSWLREVGIVVKDVTGLWYSLAVGRELFWISVTHVLSGISSLTICGVKFYLEKRDATRQS